MRFWLVRLPWRPLYARTFTAALCIALLLVMLGQSQATDPGPKRVLLLHSFGPQFVPWTFFAAQFREDLFKQSPHKIDLYEASLEGSRFQQPEEQAPIVDYLGTLFGERKLDVIVTLGAPAAFFVQKYRAQFFPSTPLVIGAPERRAIDYTKLTPNDAPVAVALDFEKWVGSILEVLPNTTHIAWAVGASPLERFWTEEFRRASQPFSERVSFEYFNDLRFEEMLKRVSELPPHSAVFYVDLRIDAAGVPLDRDLILPRLRQATKAPIFSYIDNYLGSGIVGGPMLSSETVGRLMAEATIRILNGEKAGDLKIPPVFPGAAQYDWRELQYWKISESQLPPGSIVRFREPTVWAQYRWQIALVTAICLMQTGLISALLYQHRRRQLAEVQARQRMAELAHVNRFSTAGVLTASIAHEINQPLGSILTNAETVQAILKSPSPDIVELNEIIDDIVRDDRRASEVIRRMKSLLTKAPFELKSLDLNDVARETVEFLSTLAVARKVELTSLITQNTLPILGDRIQLQQVILNLVVNGIDAMKDMPSEQRTISIRTSRVENFAELSVSDRGPGIPEDKLKGVFEPFYTSKAEGMGMGLSIARTIIEAHQGLIWAKNRDHGGASFRIRFSLVQ
jgi:signal transduction histidine kinase